ncbi:23 kDa integral membrane protein-like [Cimex lectularius]|uniref:Tetraspanin n=1 Tax=Cimex lectularius TaxID=79782 RepID=A0A8I6TCV1_CIMLE|nr:23 kDa integral membrane protein-like [Cimex lectularius]
MWLLRYISYKMQYIKYCLILFTCLFILSGLSFIILGASINAIYSDYSYFLHMKYFSPSVLLTSIGFAIFVVAFLGMFGAIKESPLFILIFGFSLGIIFILQVSAGLTNNFLMKDVEKELNFSINKTMHLYPTNNKSAINMDILQQSFQCCGLKAPADWYTIDNGTLPKSCCLEFLNESKCLYPFDRGCLPILTSITHYSGKIFNLITYVLSVMHLAGMFFAFYLGSVMKEQKRAREARKWLIRDQILNYSNDYDFKIKGSNSLPPYSP